MPNVAEMLEKLGALYRERNALYGDNYKRAGRRMLAYFPDGITLRTEEDFNRFHMFVQLDGKLSRYAEAVLRGEGHADSLDDLSVYAQMTQEVDEEAAEQRKRPRHVDFPFSPGGAMRLEGREALLTKALADILHESNLARNVTVPTLKDACDRAQALLEDIAPEKRQRSCPRCGADVSRAVACARDDCMYRGG